MTQRKKLAVFTSFSGQGGVERMIMNLVQEFALLDLEIDLLALKADSDHFDSIPDNVNLIRLKARHSSTVVPELTRYLRQERPHAMLVAKDRPGRAALKARRRGGLDTRIVIRLGTNLSGSMAKRSSFRRWLRTFPLRRGYRGVDRIVAVSDGVAEDTMRITGLPAEKLITIRNPVVTRKLLELAEEPVAHEWFSNHDLPVILAVGRLTEQKDFKTLIDAYFKLRSRHNARLIILGEGGLRGALQEQVSSLGLDEFVDLPGFTSNPWAWMKRADLFVLSSRWEGSPNVLTEAISLGTPVVATDCPSGPAELLQNGRYGPLVPMGDAAALAEAMKQVLEAPLPADVLKEACREYRADISAAHYLETLFE